MTSPESVAKLLKGLRALFDLLSRWLKHRPWV